MTRLEGNQSDREANQGSGRQNHDNFIMGFQVEGDNFELWILKWQREIKYDYVGNKPLMHGLLDDRQPKNQSVGPI